MVFVVVLSLDLQSQNRIKYKFSIVILHLQFKLDVNILSKTFKSTVLTELFADYHERYNHFCYRTIICFWFNFGFKII